MLASLARPRPRSTAPTGSTRRSPTASSCSRTCAGDDGRWHRSWQADGTSPGTPRRARRRPRRARRRVHPARRGSPGEARWIDEAAAGRRHPARPLLGRRPRRPVHHRRRRRAAGRPPEGPARQRHAVGQLDRRRGAVSASARSPARPATRTTPTRSCASLGRVIPQAPSAFSQRPDGRRHAWPTASPRSPSPATGPTWSRAVQHRWLPDAVLAWGEPYDSPAVGAAQPTGLAYVCRNYACQTPPTSPADSTRGAARLDCRSTLQAAARLGGHQRL